MSESYTIIVPADAGFVPSEDACRAAERIAVTAFPESEEVELTETERVEMVWAGGNHTEPSCPF